MVQTGFKAEAHCWKCFKENTDIGFIDGKAINLCKGCLYVVKQLSQWLNAYGLGIRQSLTEWQEDKIDAEVPEGGIEGVEGGGNPTRNARTRPKPPD